MFLKLYCWYEADAQSLTEVIHGQQPRSGWCWLGGERLGERDLQGAFHEWMSEFCFNKLFVSFNTSRVHTSKAVALRGCRLMIFLSSASKKGFKMHHLHFWALHRALTFLVRPQRRIIGSTSNRSTWTSEHRLSVIAIMTSDGSEPGDGCSRFSTFLSKSKKRLYNMTTCAAPCWR